MKLKNIILASLAALAFMASGCRSNTVVVHDNAPYATTAPVVYDTYDYYGYEPYSWQWFYVRRHHHRPPYGYGRNYDRYEYGHRGGYNHR